MTIALFTREPDNARWIFQNWGVLHDNFLLQQHRPPRLYDILLDTTILVIISETYQMFTIAATVMPPRGPGPQSSQEVSDLKVY
jgi:hypothetical protein